MKKKKRREIRRHTNTRTQTRACSLTHRSKCYYGFFLGFSFCSLAVKSFVSGVCTCSFFFFLSVRVSAEGCVRSLSLCCYTSTLSPLFLWFHETGTIVTDAYKYIYVCKCWECTKKKDKQTHRQKKKKRGVHQPLRQRFRS